MRLDASVYAEQVTKAAVKFALPNCSFVKEAGSLVYFQAFFSPNILSFQRASLTTITFDFYSHLLRLVGKEMLHPLEGRGNPNSEKPRNFPKLDFLTNVINQAEPGFKWKSPDTKFRAFWKFLNLLSLWIFPFPSHSLFSGLFFTKLVWSFDYTPGLSPLSLNLYFFSLYSFWPGG